MVCRCFDHQIKQSANKKRNQNIRDVDVNLPPDIDPLELFLIVMRQVDVEVMIQVNAQGNLR